MAPEDPKQVDSSETSPDGKAHPRHDDSSSPKSNSQGTAQPEVKEKDRWNESEIDAAVDVLERPSQIPVSSSSPTGTTSDDTEDMALPRERPVSAPSASSVEKSRRAGISLPSAPVQGRSSPRKAPRPAVGNPPASRLGASKTASQSDPVVVPSTEARADEADEKTQYLDRSRLGMPDVTTPQSLVEPEEETKFYERGSIIARTPATQTDKAKIDAAKTDATRPNATSADAEEATKADATSADADAEEATKADATSADADAEEATKADATSADADADAEEATQFYERFNSSPSGGKPSETNGQVAGPSVLTRSGSVEGSSSSWSVDRHSSQSSGVGVGILSSDAARPGVSTTKNACILTERISTRVPFPLKPPETRAGARSLPLPLPPRPDPRRIQGKAATIDPKSQPVLLPTDSSPSKPFNQGGAQSPISNPPALPSSASSGIVESTTSEAEPTSERSNEAPGGYFELPVPTGMTGVTAFSVAPRPGSPGFEEEAWLDPFIVRAGRRFLCVAASCVGASLLLSPLEAWFAQRAAVDHPSWIQLTLACAGLLMPVAPLLATTVTGLSLLLHPDAAPSLGRLPQKLRPNDVRRQARLAVILALAPLGISCWVILVARAALPLLGSNAPAEVVGSLLAAATVGLGLLVAAPILAAARYVGVRLRQNPPDPPRWGLVGAILGVLLLTIAVVTGPTSGAGSTLAIFGVFKRPELDLRAPGMLLAIVLAGYLLPSKIGKLPLVWLLAFVLLPFGLTYRAGTKWLDTRAIALAVERGAPLSRMVLPLARRITDRDQDGFARAFGGGDCDDRSASRNPGADDISENGIDEDCSGADAIVAKTRTSAATPAELLRERRAGIPTELNLILIIVDTMRADTLRHSKHVTPRIDELLDKSVIVNNAYAPASYTGKSVGPLLIGKHSSETNRNFSHFSAFSNKDTFVQQRLKAGGIRTLSVQGYWYFHQSPYGFDRGFDVVDTEASIAAGYVEGDRSSTTEKLTDRILAQLDQAANTTGRFFLWSQYTDPHAEYVWHQGFDFGPQSMGKYYGEVAFVDYHVGRILDFVRSKPWGERTAIIITSDHGEAFGEHGMIRHGFELWEPLVRVPLVMYVPGVGARQIQSRRTLIDLVPTILDLMQVGLPDGTGTDFVSGQSMLPEMLGIEGADRPRPVLVDMAQGPYTAERQAYIDGDYKLIIAQKRPVGLFDLSTDPDEKHDLLDDVALRERVVGEFRAYKKAMRIVQVKARP